MLTIINDCPSARTFDYEHAANTNTSIYDTTHICHGYPGCDNFVFMPYGMCSECEAREDIEMINDAARMNETQLDAGVIHLRDAIDYMNNAVCGIEAWPR